MSTLTFPIQVKTATASGQTPTSLLTGEIGLDPWLGRIWWLDNNGVKQYATLPGIAAAAAASDLNIAQQNILYMGLREAALEGKPVGIVDGILDPFSSTADINTGASSGYTFSSSAGTIGATKTTTTVSGSSGAISNGDTSGYPKGNAFDGNTGTRWASSQLDASISGNAAIGWDAGAGNAYAFQQIVFTAWTDPGQNVSSALLQYADTSGGSLGAWTTVGAYALGTAASAVTTIAVPSGTGPHRAWRLLANANLATSGNGWSVAEIAMQTVVQSAMVLQSATLTSAIASPSAMRALVQVDSTSPAFTANTDMIVSLSRDGGTTFTQGILSLVQTMPDGTAIYDTGWLSVSSRPAGNSTMTYKVTTPTQKAIVLTGVSMQVKP